MGIEGKYDEEVLSLSDSFESAVGLGIPERGQVDLELTVRVININEGRNEGIVKRSKVLAGYQGFIGKVREYERERGNREEALKMAIRYCREHDILREFLEEHASEVMNMLMTEWNWHDAREVWYEEGRDEGLKRGREEGLEKGLQRGLEKGLEKGREEIAKAALARGMSPLMVSDITGLDLEMIKKLAG